MKRNSLLEKDLKFIAEKILSLLSFFKNQKIFITGGTGFFGSWILETFLYLNETLDLNLSAVILTRNYKKFEQKAPYLAKYKYFKFIEGDVKNFKFFKENFLAVIHMAATSAEETFRGEDELKKFDTIVEGTRHVLEFTKYNKIPYFLFTSSGAVYGPHTAPVKEEFLIAPSPTDIKSVWGHAKRTAEFLVAYYGEKFGIKTKIARCFSFVGPYLPLNIHYAVGNFIRDALQGGPIIIKGSGEVVRSYLYAADLVVWLFTILVKGKENYPYNVGSDKLISIKELAYLVGECARVKEIIIEREREVPGASSRTFYVPNIERAKKELGLKVFTPLKEGILKTINYYARIVH